MKIALAPIKVNTNWWHVRDGRDSRADDQIAYYWRNGQPGEEISVYTTVVDGSLELAGFYINRTLAGGLDGYTLEFGNLAEVTDFLQSPYELIEECRRDFVSEFLSD